MNDIEKLNKLNSRTVPCGETLGLKCIRFQSEPPEIDGALRRENYTHDFRYKR